ncbi:AraC family transcriptional regulator [Aquabacter sp. CN5-332]|uniref:AraC family transcriptional regulator n=1 Tax=Aquabacter sp. CN5-332 TaxID=3156608 RepID=UPI0032B3D544
METMKELAALVAANAPCEGAQETSIPGLSLIRNSLPTNPIHRLQRPALCIVAQGRKQVMHGNVSYTYDPLNYLVVSLALPVVARITQASPDKPYLCVRLALDPVGLSEMALTSRARTPARDLPLGPALQVSRTTPELTDAVARLMRLLQSPEDAEALAPLAKREIYHRLLTGDQADLVRQIATTESKFHQVARAVGWIKDHFTEQLSIERLTAVSSMSKSALHEHFKAVTAMSPLQYQKQIRLQEARRLMIAEGLDAADAGFQVGYLSATQFTREYGRMYGQPPARDAARLRALTEAPSAAPLQRNSA